MSERYFFPMLIEQLPDKQGYKGRFIDLNIEVSGKSLEELMDMVDQTAHIINGYKKLELCILSDWNADPEHPDVCPEKPFPEEMMCVLSKKAWQHGVRTGVFRTAELFPMLAEEHDPMLVYVLPLHASSQVFGYCGMAYDNASGFTVSVTLFNYFSAIANGLRMLRHKQHEE